MNFWDCILQYGLKCRFTFVNSRFHACILRGNFVSSQLQFIPGLPGGLVTVKTCLHAKQRLQNPRAAQNLVAFRLFVKFWVTNPDTFPFIKKSNVANCYCIFLSIQVYIRFNIVRLKFVSWVYIFVGYVNNL